MFLGKKEQCMKVNVVFTCFNRKDKTVKCVNTLIKNKVNLDFIIVDDNSTDGTKDALGKMEIPKTILFGSGNLYWAGGMRVGIDYFLNNVNDADYVLLVNDDVEFFANVVDRMLEQSKRNKDAVIVGNCCDVDGNPTYGAIKFNKVFKRPMYYHLRLDESEKEADTFNCNAVLIPNKVIRTIGNFDPVYTHNFADYDYGFMLNKAGFKIYGTSFYVGICEDNPYKGTWNDPLLTKKDRLRLKEMPKGLPQKEWNHFLLKNCGLLHWIRYGYSAKIKILLGK